MIGILDGAREQLKNLNTSQIKYHLEKCSKIMVFTLVEEYKQMQREKLRSSTHK